MCLNCHEYPSIITHSPISTNYVEIRSINGNEITFHIPTWSYAWKKTITQKDRRKDGLISIGKKKYGKDEYLVLETTLLEILSRRSTLRVQINPLESWLR